MPAPLAAARWLHARGHAPTLLLSGARTAFGARSLLGVLPDETIVLDRGAGLPAIGPRLVHAAHGAGLWAGAVSYDAGLDLLGIASRHVRRDPALVAHLHRAYAVYDHAAGAWELTGPDGPARALLAEAIAADAPAPDLPPPPPARATSGLDRAGYAAAAREVQRLIAAGEAFEVNLAHLLRVPWAGTGWELFERLIAAAPADHAAYLAGGGIEVASASPEVFLRIADGRVETRPIKGTRPRGADAAADAALAAELAASAKDRAENVMIVDLLRNDLTQTAEPGSVRVTELCSLERTDAVMHLVSAVEARLREGVRLPDVLVSCFPGGSISGAPKRRAMELIDRLEADARGVYCGSVFAYEPARQALAASIAIRTAVVSGGEARYGAGGAVTLLSDPAEEAEETLVKARPFLRATGAVPEGWA
ncbi:MAG: anthranilate synthase component I family protein [Actinomycetota bacterium]